MLRFLLLICLYCWNVEANPLKTCFKEWDSTADIILKGEPHYSEHNFQYNIRKLVHPRGYIAVNSTRDVQISLKCLQLLNLNFAIKSGGHSYEKYSHGNSNAFVIDLSRLNKVEFDCRTNTIMVGAGAQAYALSKRIWEIGNYGLPVGGCPTVGISGFTLGGGFGPMSRKFGLMCDNVEEMEVITANQRKVRANKRQNSDLFWALQGGGGSNFGVVTKFYLTPSDATSKQIVSTIPYAISDFPSMFTKWMRWAETNPASSIDSIIYYKIFAEDSLALKFVIYDIDFEKSIEALNSIKVHFNEVDDPNNIQVLPFLDSLYPGYNATEPTPLVYEKHKSFFVSKWLNSTEVNLFNEKLVEHDYVQFLIQLCGGAISSKSRTETAFYHRTTLFELDYGFSAPVRENGNVQATIEYGEQLEPKLKQFAESIGRFIRDRAGYVNVIDGDLQCAFEKYYGNNFRKLKNVKRKYDPRDVFKFPLSIPLE